MDSYNFHDFEVKDIVNTGDPSLAEQPADVALTLWAYKLVGFCMMHHDDMVQ